MKKYIYILTVLLIIIDQASKLIITHLINIGDNISIIPNFLYLTNINNEGAAWGILHGQLLFLIVISLIAIWYIFRLINHLNHITSYDIIAYTLLLGGIIGNLIDRLIYGHVIDFINFYIVSYDFPVFNISDMAIVIGMMLIIYDMLIKGDRVNANINRR